jgi:Protein of unknown function (DUF3306)
MTADESFVSRWVRRKQKAASERDNAARTKAAQPGSIASSDLGHSQNSEAVDGPCDLPHLPPIESIVANTDIRAFLQSRVPAELTKAALRQAWARDPAIRDFIGIAENQWDFNDPGSIPGFGALHEVDDVPALLQHAIGSLKKSTEALPETPAVVEPLQIDAIGDPTPSLDLPDARSNTDGGGAEGTATTVDHAVEEIDCSPARRSHGGALPR